MFKKFYSVFLLVTFFFLNFVYAQNTTPRFSISGTIKDARQNPIAGVAVYLTENKQARIETDNNGNYKFDSLLAHKRYTVIPSKMGFTFTPTSTTIDSLKENRNISFVGNQLPYLSISGFVKDRNGAPIAGVYLTLSIGKNAKIQTDATTGAFKFDSLTPGSTYKVTPSKPGHTFSPGDQLYEQIAENKTLNFVGTPPTVASPLSISGTITDNTGKPIPEVIVVISGFKYITKLTGTDGKYKFDSLPPNKPYTIIPAKKGHVFTPVSKVVENLNENKTADFVGAYLQYLSISGYVKDLSTAGSTGSGLSGVTVTLSGARSSKVITDDKGTFKFDSLDRGKSFKVSAAKPNYVFDPLEKSFDSINENKSFAFYGKVIPQPVSISGTLAEADQTPISGALVTLSGSKLVRTWTDSKGNYKFDSLSIGKWYSIIPALKGYMFDPQNKVIDNLTKNEIVNFTGRKITYLNISGFIKDKSGNGIPEALVCLVGEKAGAAAGSKVTTGTTGAYKFDSLFPGKTYRVVVTKPKYTFEPSDKIFENLTENKTFDFIGSTFKPVSISGTVKDKNGNSIKEVTITVDCFDKRYKTLTGVDGKYKVDSLIAPKTYLVTALKLNYTFEPNYKTFTDLKTDTILNFVGSTKPYISISGNIRDASGAAISDVIVYLMGGKGGKVVTTSTGFYKFDSLETGKSYVVTPTKVRTAFDPRSKTFENITESKTQNFTAIPEVRYVIAGTVKDNDGDPVPGVNIKLSAATAKGSLVKITNDAGEFKFDSLVAGANYILNPYKTGFIFDPKEAVFEKLSEDKFLTFKGNPVPTFSISGYTKDSTGKALDNVTLVLGEGKGGRTISDSLTGFYKFEGLEQGKNYNIIPLKKGYKFEPGGKLFQNLQANQTQDFVGKPLPGQNKITVSGCISSTTNNNGMFKSSANTFAGGINVILDNGIVQIATSTDANGFFKFENMPDDDDYELIPVQDGYFFIPESQEVKGSGIGETETISAAQSTVTGLKQIVNKIPEQVELYNAYPNPFNPSTMIKYAIPTNSHVRIDVFNILGQLVTTLANGMQDAGTHQIQFNARGISSGFYLVRLQAGNTIKMMNISLIK